VKKKKKKRGEITTMLKNKTVLITGASSGIGEVTACALAREGANLVLVTRYVQLSPTGPHISTLIPSSLDYSLTLPPSSIFSLLVDSDHRVRKLFKSVLKSVKQKVLKTVNASPLILLTVSKLMISVPSAAASLLMSLSSKL
jgi:NAD(P)-dependent dehydrogenase (short-subunit alcohol dehydrogenase family)